ncbi:hypothetical protein [Ensifer aridi]|uniref:hypothetical protein n=1 Tax=Ensifer aridi TaxID=1708715 RepID=UPI000556AC6B|nr:hypothetical protein [Ensifer aridi]
MHFLLLMTSLLKPPPIFPTRGILFSEKRPGVSYAFIAGPGAAMGGGGLAVDTFLVKFARSGLGEQS